MRLCYIHLDQFKNWNTFREEFYANIICITGRNGIGKTNLLDAIYLLSSGKSYFNRQDIQLIKDEGAYFSVRGSFALKTGDKPDEILVGLAQGRKKVIRKNAVPYTRLIDHYGKYPVVMIAPQDLELIAGNSDVRRAWLDSAISLTDPEYLQALMQYENLMKQRNAHLKIMSDSHQSDAQLIEVYNQQLAPLSQLIHSRRKLFLDTFMSDFNQAYQAISGEKEFAFIRYDSQLNQHTPEALFAQSFRRDLALQRTTSGIHKDDLEFVIHNQSLKRFGSQGQQKTFLFALKIGLCSFISSHHGFPPLLLLDDVCERLDEQRLRQLFQLLTKFKTAQIFLTDTSRKRIERVLPPDIDVQYVNIDA